ncbi:MAG: hypothetical protein ACT4PU_11220 [Planctomycetota bacterium]
MFEFTSRTSPSHCALSRGLVGLVCLVALSACTAPVTNTAELESDAVARWAGQLPESWRAVLLTAEAAQEAYHVVADTPMAQLSHRETAQKVETLIVAARDLNRRAQSFALKRYGPIVAESRVLQGEQVLQTDKRLVSAAELSAFGYRLEYALPESVLGQPTPPPSTSASAAGPGAGAPAAPKAGAASAAAAPTSASYDLARLSQDGIEILSQRGKRICVIGANVTWDEPFASIIRVGGSESVADLIERLSR